MKESPAQEVKKDGSAVTDAKAATTNLVSTAPAADAPVVAPAPKVDPRFRPTGKNRYRVTAACIAGRLHNPYLVNDKGVKGVTFTEEDSKPFLTDDWIVSQLNAQPPLLELVKD